MKLTPFLLFGLSIVLSSLYECDAQDSEKSTNFRVETSTFVEGAQPFKLLTLFESGKVYDIELGSAKIRCTFYDVKRNRIVMIDEVRELQTIIAPKNLITAMTELRDQIVQRNQGDMMGLNTQPVSDKETGEYRAGYPGLLYKAESEVEPEAGMAREYNEFATWAARMNAVAGRGAPPYARLALGQLMANEKRVPKKITRTVSQGDQAQVVHSEHAFGSLLSQDDRALISKIGGMLASFRKVSHAEFSNPRIAQSK